MKPKTVYQLYKKWKWMLEHASGRPLSTGMKMSLIYAFKHFSYIDGIWDDSGGTVVMYYRRNS